MSAVRTHPIRAQLVDKLFHDYAPAGAIKFYVSKDHDPAGFNFRCPCGCEAIGGVKVAGEGAWRWNGSYQRPTVDPSVMLSVPDGKGGTVEHWHGWLKDGVWTSC
ncbi:hypothetical protein HDIA_0746 [Hartmannibacter diazotrophicus]|uniref:Uncharacterized protein n=1 Tax=Hartmannibacter diazotrophicus TaxID=1482074 RepID=A0A2C9D1N9_9HYPH|nr:DUF6527 family protein [Hartmannibacter diazotrophicus]SON54287.1 hypothetical protein HDIA_0746 [Hartmannibacter diazotrophicus]